jgi:sugar-specific transcriptional regulator TrmB
MGEMLQEEFIEVLAELGLTHLQAKVYLALAQLKSATAREIHAYSNVARQDVYRLLSELEEKDLIERAITKPTKFRPVPPNDTISILLQRKNEKTRQLQKKAIQALKKIKNINAEPSFLDSSSQFILLSESETNVTTHTNRVEEAVDNAKTNIMSLNPFQSFMQIKYEAEQVWKKAANRGVKLRFIIDGASEIDRNKLNLDPDLRNTDNFRIRWSNTSSVASVLLVDEKEAFFRITPDLKSPVLLSTNPSFVAMIKDYFEARWKSLKDNQEETSAQIMNQL